MDVTLGNVPDQSQTAGQNRSLLGAGCIPVLFSRMEFLPWNNPDNIVSEDVRMIVRQVKSHMLLFLFLIGGPANVINMVVFYKQGLKERVTLCLFALSFADWLFLTWSFLYNAETLFQPVPTKVSVTPFITFLVNNYLLSVLGFFYASPILSAIIAMDRCLCVFYPLKVQSLMKTRTMAVIIVLVYMLVFTIVFFVTLRFRVACMYDPETGVRITTFVPGQFYQAHKEAIDIIDSFVLGVAFRGGAMLVVMVSTILTIIRLRQIVRWRSETSSSLSPREVALTKMLVGSSILFIGCMSPTAFYRLVILFFPEMNSGRRHQNLYLTLLSVSDTFSMINSSFNIFVYYAMGSRYRHTFRALCRARAQPAKGLQDAAKD